MYRDEVVYPLQAELRIVRGSTIERKQMSTKTTFKRIALVTVAALSFGTMASVSPASAAASILTSVKVSDATAYGYVGETLTASVKVTVTGAATGGVYSADDSVTLTAAITSISGSAIAALTTTGATQSVDSAASESSTGTTQLNLNTFRLMESSTASANPDGYAVGNGVLRAVVSDTTTVPATVASVNFRPSTPGTYKITVTPSNVAAGVSPTYTAGVITFVVLYAGAATGDGGVATPFNTAGGVAGAGNYNQVKVTGQLGTTALGTRVVVTGGTIDAAIAGSTLSSDKTTLTIAGVTTGTPATGNINVLTPTAGSIVVTTFRESAVGTYSTTADSTVTITVRATALTGPSASSTTYMATDATAPTATTDAAVVALTSVPSKTSLADATAVANIEVIQYDALEAVASSSKTLAVTAEISGAGRIGQSSSAADATSIIAIPAGSSTTAQSATQRFYVFSDGRSGEATITIKVGGVTTLTRKVAFFGTATQLKLVAATATAPNPTKSFLAVGGTMDISVLPYDANNVKLAAAVVTVTSDTATIASVVVKAGSTGVVTVTGVAVGKSNINIKSGTATLVVPVEVTKSTGVAKLTLDKTSAQPGEKVTWTITATDVNGRPVADGTSYAFFSSVSGNMTLSGGSLPTGTETITAGVSTGSFFAPSAGSGTLTITAKQGTAHDTYIAGLKAATAAGTTYTAVSDVVSVTIVNASADEATAAAEEATAAANDATDAALSAAEAAEAATAMAQEAVDAVAELSAQVTSLISALRAQITALTNLVIKIQKKVKA
jgi:hypothetical protein